MKNTTNGTIMSYSALGNSNANIYATDIVELATGKIQFAINYDNKKVFTQLDSLGTYLVENALAAAAAGLAANLSLEQVCAALSTAPNVDRVKKIMLQDGSVLLDDTYNSQPKSLAAILQVMKKTQGYRVALLADMLELGELSDSEHELAGKLAADSLDHLVTLGSAATIMAAAAAKNGIKKVDVAHSNDEAIDYIVKALRAKSTILIKGSQAFKLNNFIPQIISDYGVVIEQAGKPE
jgi:UDP-N-acetylmuramyl pentapeptide synthase